MREPRIEPDVLPPPRPAVDVTPLFGIPPRGAGTASVESLFSHLLSICHAHRLAPRQVVHLVLPDVERRLSGVEATARHLVGWAWDQHAGREMLGMHRSAERWTQVLEAATGLTKLRMSTLLPLQAMTTGNLVTDDERVCIDCLDDDVAEGGLPYGRLLWRLRAVTCCTRHRKRLVVPTCERRQHGLSSNFLRVKLSGVCPSCGQVGHSCRTQEPDAASADEVWRAEQCGRMLAAMPAIELTEPSAVKAALKAHCAARGAVCSLALRAGAPKSVLSQWLSHPTARLNFDQLLDICAVDGLELADLLQGRLTPSNGQAGMQPVRARQQRKPVDHEAVRAELAAARNDGRSVTDVARELRVDIATLARHRDLYVPVREASAQRRAAAEEQRHLAAIQKVEGMARSLATRGRRLTPRNAVREGSQAFAPSSIEQAVFSVMRVALGDRKARTPAVAKRFGPRYLQRISEAAERLRPEIGEAQPQLPFGPE